MSSFCNNSTLNFRKLDHIYLPGYINSLSNIKTETRSNFKNIIDDFRSKLILISDEICFLSSSILNESSGGSDGNGQTFGEILIENQDPLISATSIGTQLNIEAGTYIEITSNSDTNTLTITNTAGASDGFTQGSILFANNDGTITENNDRLYWNNDWAGGDNYYLEISGNIQPKVSGENTIGTSNNKFYDIYAVQTTIGAFFETGLRTDGLCDLKTGTVVSWEGGKCVESYKDEDELVMGVVKHGKNEPIIMGAEYILVTGSVKEGDYLVTSGKKRGHCKAVKRGILFKKDLFGKVIAQSLENNEGDSILVKAMIRKM
jgi:hypothetical protein